YSVLEEAVGDPMIIIVAVFVDGQIHLARGGTFSYYEFAHPIDDRLTDESWIDMLDSGQEPALPEWSQSFISLPSEGTFFFAALTKPEH
ncbi:MAG: DUF3160 domain-containing protein, partial [Candidatus Thorarchaeota archaeon]|nr:DUF3160 domain-containing protein [Candidatus Thorarchaeota archaeon]